MPLQLKELVQKITSEKTNKKKIWEEPGCQALATAPVLWVIKAWQEPPNGGRGCPTLLSALFPKSTLKTHFPV